MRLNELRRRGKDVDWLAFLGVVSISLFITNKLMERLPIRACTTIQQYVPRSTPVQPA